MTRMSLLAGVCLTTLSAGGVHAQTAPVPADPVYHLGEIVVTARDRAGRPVGGAVIAGEDMRRFDRASVDQALDLVPGAAAGSTGGSRNERLVFVRGFDRFQTTMSIDGVRVFLPADNRIDFARFLTADLSQVQVSKGYVSVLDGPGGMGGAINLVTRRPTTAFEGELRLGVGLDGDGTRNSATVSGRVGGATDRFYGQISGAFSDRDHWALSDEFAPTALEDGGERGFSDSDDRRLNLKAGFTPNDDDEYSLTYTRQEGSKNAPYHVADLASTRYWNWPYWNLGSLAFLSRTDLGDRLQARTRLYRNTFENALFSYDNAAQTSQTQRRAFRSYYEDEAVGGNLELSFRTGVANTLRAAVYYREDEHVEWQQSFAPAAFTEPPQATTEATTSIAIEDTHAIGETFDLVVGLSWDHRDLRRAEDFNEGVMVHHPLTDDDAFNAQAMLVYRPATDAEMHLSVSSRTRFPTLFERFSARFGAAIPNPGITAERAVSYEIGARRQLTPATRLEGAVFYSDLTDALIQIPVDLGAPFGVVSQTRNAGTGEYYGVEAAVTVEVSPTISLGGNYTYLHREMSDPGNPDYRPTGVPQHKLFAWADWRVSARLTVTPSLEASSGRWTYASVAPMGYYRADAVVLANLSAQVMLTQRIDLIVGGRNMLDESYILTDGFPEEGRNFRVDLRARF